MPSARPNRFQEPIIFTMGREHYGRSPISGSETERESEQYEPSWPTRTTRTHRNGEDLKAQRSRQPSKHVVDTLREDGRSSSRPDEGHTKRQALERPSQLSRSSRSTKDTRRQDGTSLTSRHPPRGATTEDGYPTPPTTIQSSNTRHRSRSSRSREPESILGYPSPPPTIAPRSSQNSATPTRYPENSYSHRHQSRAADNSGSPMNQRRAANNSHSPRSQRPPSPRSTLQSPSDNTSYIIVPPRGFSVAVVRSADRHQPRQIHIIQSNTDALHQSPVILYDQYPYDAPFIPPHPYGDVEEDKPNSTRKRKQCIQHRDWQGFHHAATQRHEVTQLHDDKPELEFTVGSNQVVWP